MKKISWFEAALAIVVISISLYAALSDAQNLSQQWFIRDDAYYYFKVAQNISEGHGSTFDGINSTNGYHPLWLWICIPIFALTRIDLILPLRILLLVMGGLSLTTAILLYRLLGKVFTPAIGALAAIYWVFSKDILLRVYQQGLETGLAAFFIVLLLYELYKFEQSWKDHPATKKQLAILGGVATLAMFSRLDLVFLAILTGIWIVFRKEALKYFLPLDLISIFTSALISLIYRVTFAEYYRFADVAITMIAVSIIIKIPSAFLFGLYHRSVLSNTRLFLKRLILFCISTPIVVGVIMIVITPLAQFEGFPRTVIFYDLVLTSFFFGIIRLAYTGLNTSSPKKGEEASPIKLLVTKWKFWLADGITYYGIVLGALSIYMIWNKVTFGTYSPVSGQIKRWWGSFSTTVYRNPVQSPLSFFGLDYIGDTNVWYPISSFLGALTEQFWNPESYTRAYLLLLIVLILFTYFILWLNKKKTSVAIVQLGIIPLFCSAWIQVLSYHITGYAAFMEWYWISQTVIIILVIGLIAGTVTASTQKRPALRSVFWLGVAGAGLLMGVSQTRYIYNLMTYHKTPIDSPYNDLAQFLEEHTEPDSIIGMTGGGNAGYFISDRTIINMDGLINSYEYFHLLQQRKSGEYLAEIGMDYILANTEILAQPPYSGQYEDYYQLTDEYFGSKQLIRYQLTQP